MSRKHNTRHSRVRSHYPERLARRGQSNSTVAMEPVERLAERQAARKRATGAPWWARGTEAEQEAA